MRVLLTMQIEVSVTNSSSNRLHFGVNILQINASTSFVKTQFANIAIGSESTIERVVGLTKCNQHHLHMCKSNA